MEVESSTTLTVPETVRMEPRTFTAVAGLTYLMQFEIATIKPEGSPGAAMYFGVNLACGGELGGTTRSIGGTQNLLTGKPVTLRNQFLLRVDTTELQSCRVVLSSPNEYAAAEGTEVEVDVRWSMTSVSDDAQELEAERRLPLVVEPGGSRVVFSGTVRRQARQELKLIGTLHLTTCTMINGSRERGEVLCDKETIDSGGSSFSVETRSQPVGADGTVCKRLENSSGQMHIERRVHHLLLTFGQSVDSSKSECGDTIELQVVVANKGPAPLVVHGANSSYIAVPGSRA